MATEKSLKEMENILKNELSGVDEKIEEIKKDSKQKLKQARKQISAELKNKINPLKKQSSKDRIMLKTIQKQLQKDEKRKIQEDALQGNNQEPEA